VAKYSKTAQLKRRNKLRDNIACRIQINIKEKGMISSLRVYLGVCYGTSLPPSPLIVCKQSMSKI
jgi:hypothetical protein